MWGVGWKERREERRVEEARYPPVRRCLVGTTI